jgi:serine/threonine-protein kinase
MTPDAIEANDAALLARLQKIFDGQYEVERKLAAGGMAQLFLARDPVLGRALVIKILPPELTSEMSIARFRRESELTANLQHPHILPIIAAGERDGLLYYVMPFVAGESLRDRLTRDGALSIADAVEILEEMADALVVAHRQGVIHRDIKPENILLQEGHAVLADFGIAGALEGSTLGGTGGTGGRLTRTGMSLGTVGYMAPEQALGETGIDGRADIYALGVVGHEMIAGSRPFDGATMQEVMIAHLTKEPTPLDQLRPETPVAVVDAILLALRKNPQDRFQSAQEFRDAIRWSMTSTAMIAARSTATSRVQERPDPARPDPARLTDAARIKAAAARSGPRRRRLLLPVVGIMTSIAAAIGAYAWWHGREITPTEFVTIAVAPFDLLPNDASDESQLWREGMVDILARNLDGAGPLRTVSPTVVMRGWNGAATRENALSLLTRTNAQYAVYGRFTASGEEGFRLSASMITPGDTIVWSGEWIGTALESLSDSLTVALIEELGHRHQLGAARRSSVGSADPLALKAFLQGEQHYRRTEWEKAYDAYGRAVRADSGFAPALRRLALVIRAQTTREDSVAREFALRAGARNNGRGLAPRDSLLILADSLEASLLPRWNVSPPWELVRRLFATLAVAASRYPDDPEVWFTVGEARWHYGFSSIAEVSEASTLEAFERAIALDSMFAPAYIHAVELAFVLRGAPEGVKYGRRYLALDPGGRDAQGIRTAIMVADARISGLRETRFLLDSMSTPALFAGWYALSRWPDSTETAMTLLEAVGRRRDLSQMDSSLLRAYMSSELAYRGRLQESYATLGVRPSKLLMELALLGAIPPDSLEPVLMRWMTSTNKREFAAVQWALPWLADRKDTSTLRRYADAVDAYTAQDGSDQRLLRYRRGAVDAYLSLARADSMTAIKRLSALPDTVCLECYADRMTLGRLLSARPDVASRQRAVALLDERLFTSLTPLEVLRAVYRGRVLMQLDRRDEAVRAYELVTAAWSKGDPQVQPYVREAREAVALARAR